MKRLLTSLRRIAVLAWLCLLSSTASAAESPITFDAWADSFCADWVRLSPERATFTQWFSGEEQATLDGQLSVLNKTTRQRQLALAQSGVARLDAWLATPLTPTQRAGAATMRWGLARTVAGEPYAEHDFVFHQNGLHVRLVNLLTGGQPLRRASDVTAYLSRLAQVPDRLDEGITRARDAVERKLLPPRFIVERARAQLSSAFFWRLLLNKISWSRRWRGAPH